MIIYKAINLITGMSYIGQTTGSLKERKSAHLKRARLSNLKFYNAIRKYGEMKFSWIILKLCKTREELNFWEEFYIKFYNTIAPNGYNLTNGGKGSLGLKHRRETIELLSRINSGKNHPQYGIPCSEKKKKKIGDANRGRNLSEAFKKQISKRSKILWKNKKYRKKQFATRGINQRKEYIFVNSKGKEFYVNDGFKQFCKKYNLCPRSMFRSLRDEIKCGYHRGWSVRHKIYKEVLL